MGNAAGAPEIVPLALTRRPFIQTNTVPSDRQSHNSSHSRSETVALDNMIIDQHFIKECYPELESSAPDRRNQQQSGSSGSIAQSQQQYQCDRCPNIYPNSEVLERHKSRFHRNRRYECVSCRKVWSLYTNIRRHVRHSHAAELNRYRESFRLLQHLAEVVCNDGFSDHNVLLPGFTGMRIDTPLQQTNTNNDTAAMSDADAASVLIRSGTPLQQTDTNNNTVVMSDADAAFFLMRSGTPSQQTNTHNNTAAMSDADAASDLIRSGTPLQQTNTNNTAAMSDSDPVSVQMRSGTPSQQTNTNNNTAAMSDVDAASVLLSLRTAERVHSPQPSNSPNKHTENSK